MAFFGAWQWEHGQHKKDFEYRSQGFTSVLALSFEGLVQHVNRLNYFVYNELILQDGNGLAAHEWQKMAAIHYHENGAIRDIAWLAYQPDGFEVVLASQSKKTLLSVDMDIQNLPALQLALARLDKRLSFVLTPEHGETVIFMLSAIRDESYSLLGVVAFSWAVDEHFENSLGRFVPGALDSDLLDITDSDVLLLHHHQSRTRAVLNRFDTERRFFVEAPIDFVDRKWLLTFSASPAFFQTHHIILAWGVLILGLLMTLMLSVFVGSMKRRHYVVEQQVIRRTQELERAQARYRRLSETIPDAVGVHRYGKWIYVNPAAVILLGVENKEELLDRSVLEVIQEDDHERAIQRIVAENQDGINFPLHEEHWLRMDGSDIYVELQATSVDWDDDTAMLIVVRDISARKEAESERQQMKEQVEHVQRLESLGVLAGGIAHDFNNLLGAIMGNISIAQMELEEGSEIAELLEHTEIAAQRAADLCNQMLAYSGKGKFVIKTLHLSDLIREMLELLKVYIGKHVQIQLELADELPTIDVDVAQMQQVIMNLVINAAEAIDESGGTIYVRTDSCYVDQEELAKSYLDEGLSEGHYVILEIEDTGSGMDAETQKKMFDPFFTTKFTGRGLGMSAILGIIRGHKAAIYIDSELGKGSCFKIFFPSILDENLPKKVASVPQSNHWTGKGLVMLVDDEDMIRQVGKQMLEKMGFDVLLAQDGEHALKLYTQRHADIHLIIMDVMMPGMKGTDCVRKIHEAYDNVRVIMSSGYSEKGVINELGSGMLFLQKPYNYSALEQVVRKMFQA